MIVAGNDEGDPVLNEELVETISRPSKDVEAVEGQRGKEGFVEKDKLEAKRSCQFRTKPRALPSRYPRSLTWKHSAEHYEKRIAHRERVVLRWEKPVIHIPRHIEPYVVVSGCHVKDLIRPCCLEKLLPLAQTAGFIDGIARVDDSLDLQFVHSVNEGRIDRVARSHMGVADYGEGGILRPDQERFAAEEA